MWAYLAAKKGKLAEAPAAAADMASKVNEATTGQDSQFPVLAKSPLYVRESMMFPYTKGLQFQDAVYKRLGQQSFTAVFDHAPASTQQVLHPEIYAKLTKPVEVKLPELADHKKFRLLAEGSVGELDEQILLTEYFDQKTATEISINWRGGAFRLYESKLGKQPVLQSALAWDSENTAKRHFDIYKQLLKKKWDKFEVKTETETELTGVGEYGPFRLLRDGAVVFSTEGGLH